MAVSEAHVESGDVIVVDARTAGRAWLQAADVIVGEHRDRRRACAWVVSIRRRFPGCAVAVAWSRQGRWLVVGWHGTTIRLRGGPFDGARAAEIGGLVHQLWACGGEGRS
jgi:hypothetical protein